MNAPSSQVGLAAAAEPSAGGDLSRLIETERRLEREVAAAREQADRVVADAVTAARAREQALDADLEEEVSAVEAGIAAERARDEDAIVTAARRAVERFDGVTGEEVAEIAGWLVARVIGWPGGGRGGGTHA
jgi:hypothetical protein